MVRLPAPLRPLFPYLKPAYVQATRMIAPTNQLLSRRRGNQLPTGVVPSLHEAAVASRGIYALARPAEVVERGPLLGLPPDLPLTDPSDGQAFDAVGVAELPGGRVLGPHRAVIDGNGDLVEEVSWYFGTTRPREHPVFLNPFPAPALRVDGRLGVLGCRGDGNYYHFLMDVITKLGVLQQTPDIAMPERWYAPMQTRFQRELLDLAGIDLDQVIDAAVHPHVRADVLVVPAPPAMSEKNPPWAVQWLRDLLLPKVDLSGPRQRVFVTRGPSANNRTVTNEAAVRALLARHDFVEVDPGELSVVEQIQTFARAELIVAPHGAALANLVFVDPDAALIELFPAGCLLPDYWRMVCGIPGFRYRYLSALGSPPRRGRAATIVRDIEVDLGGLETLLHELE